MYIRVYLCANVYVCIYMCMYMYVYVRIYVFVYMYVYICLYVSVDIYKFLILFTSVTFWYYTHLALLLIQLVGCHILMENISINPVSWLSHTTIEHYY